MKQTALMRRMMVGSVMGVVALAAQASCNDDLINQIDRSAAKSAATRPTAPAVVAPMEPQLQLQSIAREASRRSAQLGAVKLLAEAAAFDVDEARGGLLPQVSINGTLGPAATRYSDLPTSKGLQTSGTLSFSGLLYDGGRLEQLTQWRRELASAARFGVQSAKEQVVLEAISTALERNRYRVHAQVYQQYARKMGCLVDVLQQIVAEDRGRASELLQARKTQAQAELARDNALASSRQAEIRLRKLIGDQVPSGEGITAPLTQTLDSGEVLRLLEQNNDIQQLRAQAEAADRYAQAVKAGQKPQVNWVASSSGSMRGETKSLSVQAGLSVSYSIFNGGADEAAAQAASRRALSTREQLAEFMATRYSRVSEVHDAASSSFDRARRFVDVLKDSDRVRAATFQQWSQLGRRSLFDVMSAEGDHFNLRIAYVNALHDGYQANAQLRSMGEGLASWLAVPAP